MSSSNTAYSFVFLNLHGLSFIVPRVSPKKINDAHAALVVIHACAPSTGIKHVRCSQSPHDPAPGRFSWGGYTAWELFFGPQRCVYFALSVSYSNEHHR